MSGPVDKVLAALAAAGLQPKRSGSGWKSCCPAHAESNPSFELSEGDDGRVLVHCFVGCSADAICSSLGLRLSDLMPERNGRGPPKKASPARQRGKPAKKSSKLYATAVEARQSIERQLGRAPACFWTYEDEAGVPTFLSVRFDLGEGDKTFRPVSRVEGGWVIGDPPGTLVLYRLPHLVALSPGSTIVVTEGEKCADVAAGLGWASTTSAHGAKSASKSHWSPVRSHHIVIMIDNDEVGEEYGRDVAALAFAAGAISVKIVRLFERWPELPRGGDLADLVHAVETETERATLKKEVEKLIAQTVLEERAEPDPPRIPRHKPFPTDALPMAVAEFVRTTAASMDADEAMIAAPAFSILAGAVGNSVQVAVKPGWGEPCAIWTGVIAKPGTMKSPTLAAAASPLYEAEERANAEHKRAVQQHARDTEEWEADDGDAADKPRPPQRRELWVADTTPEALAQVLERNPRGVTAVHDELAGMFGGLSRYQKHPGAGEPGAALYKSAYSGEPYKQNRKGHRGNGEYVSIRSPLISVTGAIQPGAFERIVNQQHVEDGLASRFMWVHPPDSPSGWSDGPAPDPRIADEYAGLFRRLQEIPFNADEAASAVPMVIELAPDARTHAARWVRAHAQRMAAESHAPVRAALAKLKGGAFRIALLFHLVRHVSEGRGDKWSDPGPISAETLTRALVVADWFCYEAKRVYGMWEEKEEERESRELEEWIRRRGEPVSVRDLMNSYHRFRGKQQDAEAALEALVEARRGRWVDRPPGPKGGRPSRYFELFLDPTICKTPSGASEDGVS